MLITGQIDPQPLLDQKLFKHFHDKYQPDQSILDKIETGLSIEVVVILGTWCPDCHLHVGQFIALMAHQKKWPWQVSYIGVDREKTDPEQLSSAYDFDKVPTFIFKKDGREIGRIEEQPMVSLEADIYSILKRA